MAACRRAALPAVTLAVVLAAGCTSSGTTGAAAAGSASPGGGSAPASGSAPVVSLQQAYVSVIKKMLPSVVEIRTASGLGSGVVFDSAGDIVTNAHVVGTATTFQVLLSSSASPRAATLAGTYPPDDLAVIRVSDAAGLRPAVFGDSAKLEVGDIVLAIGTPLGLASSVTEGIVSAVGRTVFRAVRAGLAGRDPARHDPDLGVDQPR